MSGARNPRVLYLAFYFPPSRASGVYRARATANFLADKGWDVTTFAAPMSFLVDKVGSLDESLVETIDPRVRVIRPEFRTFAWDKNVREFGLFRRNFPQVAIKLHRWNTDHVFPEAYVDWGVSSVRRALALHARERFDLVVATGNPFVSFGAAWWFHRITGVPYVVDYRDSWTLDLFNDAPAFHDGHPAWTWENRVLRDASMSVFVNEALRGWHADRYPKYADRMTITPNGWDTELLDLSAMTAEADLSHDGPLRFSYLGTISAVQPVEELVGAFERAREHPDLANSELNLYGYLGFFQHSRADLTHRLGTGPDSVDNGVHYRGPVAKTEVAAIYEGSDVLVFMAGGAKYVTSGKIFEYMAAGRPIVSVHQPGIAATEVLRDYPLWFTANSMDPDEIGQAMIAAGKAARDVTAEQRQAARDYANAYTREAMLTPFEARLRQIIGGKRRRGSEEHANG
jgi:glycosyltransferase involved in cell wall biosynthesis